MKIMLAIMMLVVMLVALIVPVAMAMVEVTAACEHPAVSANQVTVLASANSATHSYKKVNRVTCNVCGAVVATTDVAGSAVTTAHTVITIDKGHVNGTNRHEYQKKCSVCNYVNLPYLGTHNCIEIHQCEFGARDVCSY